MSAKKAYIVGVLVTILIVAGIVFAYVLITKGQSEGIETRVPVPVGENLSVVSISWEEVSDILASGNVTAVSQDAELNVRIALENGKIYTSKEPEIDAIVRLVNECGLSCSGLWVFTKTDDQKNNS